MKNYIFNSSMPRSGSELLQVILHQNPSIYGSPTSPLCEYITSIKSCQLNSEVRSQPDELMKQSLFSTCKYAIQGYYEPITNRPIACDKSRQWMWNYDLLKNSLGQTPKMICMIRDLRDIFVSMEMNWRKNRHLPIGPDNPATLEGMMIDERIAMWSHDQPVGYSAKRLHDAGTHGYLNDIFILKYEDLTRFPDQCMQKMYEYLELPYFQHDFNNIVKEVDEDHKWHGPYGNHDVKQELTPSVSRYNEIFSPELNEQIIGGHEWYFKKFYPEALEQSVS